MAMKKSIPSGIYLCLLGGFFYCLEYLLQVSPSVMLNHMMQSFHTDTTGIALMGSFFFYAYACMQLPVGSIIDYYGARFPVCIALLLCCISIIGFCQSNCLWEAVLARTLIGATSAFAFISTLTLIKENLDPSLFTTATGVLQCLGALGSLAGQEPIRLLTNHFGWQLTLYGIALLLLTTAILFLLCKFQKQSHRQQLNNQFESLFSYIKNRRYWIVMSIGALSWMPVGAFGSLWGIPFMVAHFHINTIESSHLMRLFWIGLASSPVIGLLNDYTKKPYWIILGLFVTGFFSLIFILENHNTFLNMMALYGLGISCSIQSLSLALVRNEFPSAIFARLASIVNMSAIIGAGIAQYITIKIMNYTDPGFHINTNEYSFHTYQIGLSFLPICALIGSLLIITMIIFKGQPSK